MPIRRAFALDAARHLAIAGRYPAFLAVPDRWATWRFDGLRAALALAREFEPDVVWSTFPLATAHRIAAAFAGRTGIPWVADMRDPMVEHDSVTGEDFPRNPRVRAARLAIEKEVVRRAARVVFCTDGARRICLERYGTSRAAQFAVVPNGYDETAFAQAEARAPRARRGSDDEFVMLHSGTVYPGSDRGPEALFAALRELRRQGALPRGFRLVMRASGHDAYIAAAAERLGVSEIVAIEPPLPYQEALCEMLASDALLLLQGRTSNPAIPAKVYEYLRARTPILALVDTAGDTAALLRGLDAALLAPLDDATAIGAAIRNLVALTVSGRTPLAADDAVEAFSRRRQTGALAGILAAAR
jgi:glycosyltransferase involved in cell wall biosynthesis